MVKKKSAKKESKEEFSMDFTKISGWFKRLSTSNYKVWLTVILILIPMFFSIYFRAYPYSLPVTNDWAYNSVYNSVRSQVSNDVNKQYPNLPIQNKNQMIDEQVAQVLESQKDGVDSQVKLISQNLKDSFQDDTGQTYLLAIDPYFYYRYSRNMLQTGHYGDLVINGKEYDNHKFAPIGGVVSPNINPYIILYFHKFMGLFTNNSLMKNMFFIPILLSALAVIPAFFIAKRRVGYFGGFVAAMIIAVHSSFIGRTAGGFADTDAYNVLFPLFIAWFFIEAFESKNLKKQLFYLLLGGFFVGVYSFAWSGWWYIFDFLIGVILVYLGYAVIRGFVNKKSVKTMFNENIKSPLYALILFIVSSGIFVSLISGFNSFIQFIQGPLSFSIIKQAAKANLWPNVYTTVAELNPASIASIIAQNGGKFLFFIAAFGVVLTMIKKDDILKKDLILMSFGALIYLLLVTNTFITMSPVIYMFLFVLPLLIGLFMLLKDDRKIDIKYALFLTIWFVGTIYASVKGTRFVLLMVPAFAVAFGIGFGTIQSLLSNFVAREFKFNKKIVSAVFMILLLFFLLAPIKAANNTAKGEVPSMNDAWWNTLTQIKNNSSKDAIITSWWDFGHWFKAVADRPVTFDGASQNTPQAHWVGKLLLTNDENLSVGILRMLDCGANSAFEEVNKKYDDTEKAVNVVYDIIKIDKDSAKVYLKDKGFNNSAIEKILSYTHCQPPEAFLITSNDMISKAGVWAHFGSWSFEKAFIYNNLKNNNLDKSVNLLTKRFNMTENNASDYYFDVQSLTTDEAANAWIAPWPSYTGAVWKGCTNQSDIVTCNLNIGLGRSNQGYDVVLSGVKINLTDPSKTRFLILFIDPNTGTSSGQQEGTPSNLIIASNNLQKYPLENSQFQLDVLYDQINNRAMTIHPSLSESMFTKLYFLDGRYTNYFNKFSDKSAITGGRIIVWNVDWNNTI